MIDVTTSRTIALHTHLPPLIFGLSICVALLSGLIAGYDMARRKKPQLVSRTALRDGHFDHDLHRH
jgi:hypothetical protein